MAATKALKQSETECNRSIEEVWSIRPRQSFSKGASEPGIMGWVRDEHREKQRKGIQGLQNDMSKVMKIQRIIQGSPIRQKSQSGQKSSWDTGWDIAATQNGWKFMAGRKPEEVF